MPKSNQTILLADEDDAARAFLATNLTADGYLVTAAEDRSKAIALLSVDQPVIADVNGQTLDLLDAVRTGDGLAGHVDPDTPMIVLSQRPDDIHRNRVLERGGDDIIAKPFSYPELRARVAAVLRRAECRRHQRQLRVASLTIDLGARHVRVGADPVELSAKEYELLVALANDPYRVFTREELLREVWGYRTPSRTVDSHACRLRRKLLSLPRAARHQRLGHRLPLLRPAGVPAANRDPEHTMSWRDPHPALAPQPTCRQRPSSTTTEPYSLALEISHASRLRRKLCGDADDKLVVNVWGVATG